MANLPGGVTPPFIDLLCSIADDKFILGHRDSDWTGLGPILEEDIAFAAMSQDEIGHAGALFELTARLLGGTTADKLAYGRRPEEYRCAAIVELADEFDWSIALARHCLCDHLDILRLTRLSHSSEKSIAALAARLAAEEQIHIGHGRSWVRRLGQAGGESQRRMQNAFDKLAPLASGLFEETTGLAEIEQSGLYPRGDRPMFDEWRDSLAATLRDARIQFSVQPPAAGFVGGRRGRHSPEFKELLDELCEVYRLEPEGAW